MPLSSSDLKFWEDAAIAALSGVLANSSRSTGSNYAAVAGDAALFADSLLNEMHQRTDAEPTPEKHTKKS